MFCANCGTKIPEGAKFCLECGTQVQGIFQDNKMRPVTSGSGLVAAKCTNCGAALSVDPGQEAAICNYCNMPYIVERAIQNYNVTNISIGTQINISGPDADNLLSLAESALNSGKYDEAVDYANRVLEMDPSNVDAWITKILSAGYDIEGDRSSEIAAYVESALDNGADYEGEIRLYGAVLDVSMIHIRHAIRLLGQNTESITRQLKARRDKRDIGAMDSGYVLRTTGIANEAIEYREIIPDEIINGDERLMQKIVDLYDVYNDYIAALSGRYSLYGASLSSKVLDRKKANQARIKKGLDIVLDDAPQKPSHRGLIGRLFG